MENKGTHAKEIAKSATENVDDVRDDAHSLDHSNFQVAVYRLPKYSSRFDFDG
jgi:hypothetical protein